MSSAISLIIEKPLVSSFRKNLLLLDWLAWAQDSLFITSVPDILWSKTSGKYL